MGTSQLLRLPIRLIYKESTIGAQNNLMAKGQDAKLNIAWCEYDMFFELRIYGKLAVKPRGIPCKKYKNIRNAIFFKSLLFLISIFFL